MQDATRTIQRAAHQLDEAAQALEQAIADLGTLQDKHDGITKRIIELVKTRDKGWDATARSALAALGGKHALQQRALDRARNTLSTARAAYDCERVAFDTLSSRYADSLAQQKTARLDAHRREGALCRVIHQMVNDLWPGRDPEGACASDFAVPETSFGYIALDIPRFLTFLMRLDAMLRLDPDYADDSGGYRPVSYLEVGCGQGRNLIIARNAQLITWSSLSGFDLNPVMIKGGQDQLGLGEALFTADALTFDYGGYDVIFSYRPLSDPVLQTQLEERMVRTMTRGSYFLAPYAYDLTLYPALEPMGDGTEIWKKTGEHQAP